MKLLLFQLGLLSEEPGGSWALILSNAQFQLSQRCTHSLPAKLRAPTGRLAVLREAVTKLICTLCCLLRLQTADPFGWALINALQSRSKNMSN